MQSNGLATVLLLIPVLTVPALAIFGIPQFAPVVASPLDDDESEDLRPKSRLGESSRSTNDDLFGDDNFGSEPEDLSPPPRKGRSSRSSVRRDRSAEAADEAPNKGWDGDLVEKDAKRANKLATDADSSLSSSNPELGSFRDALATPKPFRKQRRELPSKNGRSTLNADSEFDSKIVQAGNLDDGEFERGESASRPRGVQQADVRDAQRGVPESASEPLSWQGAVARLNELEIRNFRLEPAQQAGQFIFICSYTPPDAPRVSYRFEATADDPLKAVDKVLEQIVDWRQRR